MSNQRQLSLPSLPASLAVRTKKDQLYNDFLGVLREENALFPAAEVDSLGKNFVKTIVECLWYVDGHHEKLKKQSAPFPDYYTRFTDYNRPQLSKHRERQSTNLIYHRLCLKHCHCHCFKISKRHFGAMDRSRAFTPPY